MRTNYPSTSIAVQALLLSLLALAALPAAESFALRCQIHAVDNRESAARVIDRLRGALDSVQGSDWG